VVTDAIEDSGSGLSDETAKRMFERFWRADPARGTGGSGLGLAIAQGLVEAQGGRIWAENRPEGGARVAFTLQPAYARPFSRSSASARSVFSSDSPMPSRMRRVFVNWISA